MAETALKQLLSLNPNKMHLASHNKAVRQWNLEVLDDLAQTAIRHFPDQPSDQELQSYRALNNRLQQFSHQFMERQEAGYSRLAQYVEELSEKLNRDEDPRVTYLLSHPITSKVLKYGGVIDSDRAAQYRLKLIDYVERIVVQAIPHLKRKIDRKQVRFLLQKLIDIQYVLERFDIDGAFDEALRKAIKQFLFNGVCSHHIYYHLRHYQPGEGTFDTLETCITAAKGIQNFISMKLVPFLRDPDVDPSRDDIETIVENLKQLKNEFVRGSKRLLNPTIKILESFL